MPKNELGDLESSKTGHKRIKELTRKPKTCFLSLKYSHNANTNLLRWHPQVRLRESSPNRRIQLPAHRHHKPDLIVQRHDKSAIFALDVTVRTEIDDVSRQSALDDKATKYAYLHEHFHNRGFLSTDVRGLLSGARGAMHSETTRFLRNNFGIPKAFFEKISREILRHSIGIIHEVFRNK